MTSKYNVSVEEKFWDNGCDAVHINLEPYTDSLDAFIDIYVDDGDGISPFKTVEDAKLFAEIIVKLLNTIGDNDDIE